VPLFFAHVASKPGPKERLLTGTLIGKWRFDNLSAAKEYAVSEIEKPHYAGRTTVIEVVQQNRRKDGQRPEGAVKFRLKRDIDGQITRTPLV
jgi:hypothetical protein